jgi:ATP-dependent Clp protease ATP-binding subunit ClpC
MVYAREEALRFKHDYVGTEHILLGLIRVDKGTAVAVLKKLKFDLHSIKLEVEKLMQPGTKAVDKEDITFPAAYTQGAKNVLELSKQESLNLGHWHIGTEHLLLGLLREEEGIAHHVLIKSGLDIAKLRKEIIEHWAKIKV